MSRRRSKVWNHFNADKKGRRAKCVYCSQLISFACGSSGNLNRHLKVKHPTVHTSRNEPFPQQVVSFGTPELTSDPQEITHNSNVEMRPPEKPSSSRSATQASMSDYIRVNKPDTVQKSKIIDEQLLKFIVKGYHPFSVVDEPEFKTFVNLLSPGYNLPTRKTVSTSLLPQLYNKTVKKIKQTLENVEAVCLTTDSWTSINNQSFLAITAHYINSDCQLDAVLLGCVEFRDGHTAQKLSVSLKETVREWALENKVVAVVSDNASNIVAAIRLCNWQHLPCFAHSVNLVVHTGLCNSEITVFKKVKAVVEYFKSSAHALELLSVQKQRVPSKLKLKEDVVTRWNSTFQMMKQILQIKDAVVSTLALLQSDLETLTPHEWIELECATEVLQVFEEVTLEISSEKSVSIAKVLLLSEAMNSRLIAYEQTKTFPQEVASLLKLLKEQLQKHFRDVEDNELITQSTILDPRFKKYGFSNELKFTSACDSLKKEVCGVSVVLDRERTLPPSVTGHASSSITSSLWRNFDNKVQKVTAVQNPTSAGIVELNKYLQEPLLDRREDPLSWWKERRAVYPHLYEVVKKRLCIVATSVPCERIFSKIGQIITENRSRLTISKASQVVFLNRNL